MQIVWALALYKITCLVVGTTICALGFRLFVAGVSAPAGELDVAVKDLKLLLRSAAPGTFFAVLGSVIVVATIVQGLDFSLKRAGDDAAATSAPAARTLETPPPLP